MELITIISVIAVIIGWFVNGELNRRNEISKKRFEYRMTSLQSFLEVWFFIQNNPNPFQDPAFLSLIQGVRKNFQLYGLNDEIQLYEMFINSAENQDLENANLAIYRLVELVRLRIRKELNLRN